MRILSLFPGRHRRLTVRLAVTACLLAGSMSMLPAPAAAQADPSLQAIVAKLNRLEADLNSLQRNVYRGTQPAGEAATPAAVAPGGADLGAQFFAYEESLRRLTSQVEENSHRLQQMERQLTRLTDDLEFRLQEIEGKLGMSALGGTGTAGSTPSVSTPVPVEPPRRAVSSSDPAPQQLGSLSVSRESGAPRAASDTPSAARPGSATAALTAVPGDAFSGSARERYNASLQLIRVGQLSEAEAALQAFLQDHPQDPLAGNAQYWLGETFYARNEYEQAAAAFLAGYRNHPENSKAPDNLLKLGISLVAMGQRPEACPVFDKLLSEYPDVPGMVRDRARDEKVRAGC